MLRALLRVSAAASLVARGPFAGAAPQLHVSAKLRALRYSSSPSVSTKPRIQPVWLLHYRESHQTTNTGFLIETCVPSTQKIVYRPGPDVVDVAPLLADRDNVAILFPGEGAQELGPQHLVDGALTLIVFPSSLNSASSNFSRATAPISTAPLTT